MKPHYQTVTEAIAFVLDFDGTDQLNEKTRLESDLGMDSGLMLELIMELEDRVPGLVINQAQISYAQFKTVASVCDYVVASVQEVEAA